MRLLLTVTLLVSLASLLTSVTSVYGHEKVENPYFSLKVPHAWRYAEHSNTEMASLFGIGPSNQIIIVPSQFDNILFNSNKDGTLIYEKIYDSGAFSQFTQDNDYYIKNAPLTTYIKYLASKYPYLNITSQQDSIVGKEKAVKIEGSDNSGTIKLVIYLILHDKEAYNLDYVANVNDFDKYLSEFEEMIKSFRFNDKQTSQKEK